MTERGLESSSEERLAETSVKSSVLTPPLSEQLGAKLAAKEALFWLNDRWRSAANDSETCLSLADVADAEERLERFAPLLAALFPELQASSGIIESDLAAADRLKTALLPGRSDAGRWLVKGDHALPIAGSIKARGGIYEVLVHAERLARGAGLLPPGASYLALQSKAARALFNQHRIVVGSTGNLALSIGIMAAALGLSATVHMSADAKAWKKERLRAHGVEVIEHAGSFTVAVAEGRRQACQDPGAYFVDDENSSHLFLGYAVAVLRLKRQLEALGVQVDQQHPLFVYLPCGVGGAAGGITFALREIFGDSAHCFFAEPVGAPAMLARLASGSDRRVSIEEFGLDGRTEADGLAVGIASEFVAPLVATRVSGIYTVADDQLFVHVYLAMVAEGLRLEPSAAAGFDGPRWILESAEGAAYALRHGISDRLSQATHILWTTGGLLVPDDIFQAYLERGAAVLAQQARLTSLFSRSYT